jgi:hypothetical protein
MVQLLKSTKIAELELMLQEYLLTLYYNTNNLEQAVNNGIIKLLNAHTIQQ